MDISVGFVTALGVAFLGGWVSWLASLTSRENKISEFRQEWIEELRRDLAEYMGEANAIVLWLTSHAQHKRGERESEMISAENGNLSIQNILALYDRVSLRLPLGEGSKELELRMKELYQVVLLTSTVEDDKNGHHAASIKKARANLSDSARQFLKIEWEVAKLGSEAYRNAQSASKTAGIFIGVAIVCYFMFFSQVCKA